MNARFAVVMMVLVALAIMAFPATAAINKIPAGGEVFLGEKGLDVSAATGGSSQIAWWQPGTNTDTEQRCRYTSGFECTELLCLILISWSDRPATGTTGTTV